MVLLINNDEVEQVLTMPDTLAVLEDMYRELGRGSAVYRARTDLHTPTTTSLGPDTPSAHYLKSMDGAVPSRQAAAIRLTSDVVAFPLTDGLGWAPSSPPSATTSTPSRASAAWAASCRSTGSWRVCTRR